MAEITRRAAISIINGMLLEYEKAIQVCLENKDVLTVEASKITADYESNGIHEIILTALSDNTYFENYENIELYGLLNICRDMILRCKLPVDKDLLLIKGVTDASSFSIMSDVYKNKGSYEIDTKEKVKYEIYSEGNPLDAPISRLKYAVEWEFKNLEGANVSVMNNDAHSAIADYFENNSVLFNQFDRSFSTKIPGSYEVTANIYEKDLFGRKELIDKVSLVQKVKQSPITEEDKERWWETVWGALQGEFNEDPSGKQILIDLGLNFIPGVGQVCDARDIVACLDKLLLQGRVSEVMIWVTLLLTAVGCIPYAGDVIKSGCKAILKGSDDIVFAILKKLDAEDVYKAFKIFQKKFVDCIDEAIALVNKWIKEAKTSKYGKKIEDLLGVAGEYLNKAVDFVKKQIDEFAARLEKETQKLLPNKALKFVNGIPSEGVVKALKTEPGTAFFWSGCAKVDPSTGKLITSGDEVAAEIAKKSGGTTLETQIKVNNIDMPKWDFDVPESITAWEEASAAYAKQVSGEVRAVVGKELREGNIWENIELPRLMENKGVTKITTIDPDSLSEVVIFERKAGGEVIVKQNETLVKSGKWDEVIENLEKGGEKVDIDDIFNESVQSENIVELINEVQKSAKFKNATKYLDDIIIENGKANPSKLRDIRLALEKGEFTYDEVAEIYNTMCKLNISEAYETELIEHMDFGKYLSNMVGEAPKNMCNPHAHHILFKIGNREKQKLLVKEGQKILRKYGIDPIAGKEVLCWAPNRVVGQHDIKALQMVVDGLKKIDENNGSYERVVRFLNQMGRISSQR